jgi:hypothetical protein
MVTDNSNSQNFYSEIEKWNDMSPKDGTREFGWAVYYSVIYYANAIIANKDLYRLSGIESLPKKEN